MCLSTCLICSHADLVTVDPLLNAVPEEDWMKETNNSTERKMATPQSIDFFIHPFSILLTWITATQHRDFIYLSAAH